MYGLFVSSVMCFCYHYDAILLLHFIIVYMLRYVVLYGISIDSTILYIVEIITRLIIYCVELFHIIIVNIVLF